MRHKLQVVLSTCVVWGRFISSRKWLWPQGGIPMRRLSPASRLETVTQALPPGAASPCLGPANLLTQRRSLYLAAEGCRGGD